MSDYVCSRCGAGAYYDGRCGDGPVLMCGCDRGQWIDDGRGGYYDNPTGASAVPGRPIAAGYPNHDRSAGDRLASLEAENEDLRKRLRALEKKAAKKAKRR